MVNDKNAISTDLTEIKKNPNLTVLVILSVKFLICQIMKI